MALRGASGLRRAFASGRRRRASIWAARANRGAGIDLGAVLQFVLAIDNDDVAGIQSRVQTDAVASCLRNSDGANLRCAVAAGSVDISSLGAALNGGDRNDNEITFGVHEKVYVDELVGEERVVLVAEDGLELVSSGGYINLVVDGLKFARGDFCLVVAIIGIDGKLNSRTELGVD